MSARPCWREFADPETLLDAARRARGAGWHGLDAHVALRRRGAGGGARPRRRRASACAMLLGGLASGAFAYWLQWYSAVLDYPLNAGGRPLHSWPVFLIPSFEVGHAGRDADRHRRLPGLTRPAAAAPPGLRRAGFDRASQDRSSSPSPIPQWTRRSSRRSLDGLGRARPSQEVTAVSRRWHRLPARAAGLAGSRSHGMQQQHATIPTSPRRSGRTARGAAAAGGRRGQGDLARAPRPARPAAGDAGAAGARPGTLRHLLRALPRAGRRRRRHDRAAAASHPPSYHTARLRAAPAPQSTT